MSIYQYFYYVINKINIKKLMIFFLLKSTNANKYYLDHITLI